MPGSKADMKLDEIRKWLAAKNVAHPWSSEGLQRAVIERDLRPLKKEDLPSVFMYKRTLPHWELDGSTYFITFRVQKELSRPLESRVLASCVEEVLWLGHGERFVLDAYVIMPDHVHVLLRPMTGWTLARILQGIKGYSARQINAILGRKGAVWQKESFDHLIRHEEDWLDKLNYIHMNPVTAGLVDRPEDYPFSSMATISG